MPHRAIGALAATVLLYSQVIIKTLGFGESVATYNRTIPEHLVHISLNPSRADSVHSDPVSRVVLGVCLGQAQDPVFRDHVW